MKRSENISGFRNRQLAIQLPWAVLACFLFVGVSQLVFADSVVSDKVKAPEKAAQVKVKAPKAKIKVLAPAPVQSPVKKQSKAQIKVPVEAQAKVEAPAVKAAVPKVEASLMMQTGFGFSQAAENLKSTVDSVMIILGNEYFQNNVKVRREALWEILSQRIDFERMARRSLAGEWATRTPQEKKQFVRLFEKLMKQSYVSWIEDFKEGRMHYLSERVKGRYAKIQTRIFEAGQSVDVEYKLVRQKSGWQVYDFMIQGVSVVRNYRSQFARVLNRGSYQSLLRRLKAQVG